MRILLVTHFYPAHGGGVERVAAQLAQRMATQGHEIVWCASDADEPPAMPGVQAVPMRSFHAVERLSGFPYPVWSPGALLRLARCLRQADAVHVHDNLYFGSLAAAWLARREGKPWVVTQHIGQKPMPWGLRQLLALGYRIGTRVVLRGARGVACISPAVRRYFFEDAGQRAPLHYVPNGVDTQLFRPRPRAQSRAAALTALGFDPLQPLLLFVGRFVPVKRLALVRQMALLRPQWQWCVIGHGPDRPLVEGLPNVRVLGAQTQDALTHFYAAADLLVLPSASEGFPLVVQEAMACGLPACITAHVAAGAEMPAALWLELPEPAVDIAHAGAQAIERWWREPAEAREAQRSSCAGFAAASWSWDAAVAAHLNWLAAPPR
jgi:glycosyltransferase involved in cell wall biosynthesis